MRLTTSLAFALSLLLVLCDNARPQPPDKCPENHHQVPNGAIKIQLPDVQQPDEFSCGVASLMSILAYYGKGPEDYDALKKKLHTSKKNGVDYRRIVAYAKEVGLQSDAQQLTVDKLVQHLDRREPVICSIQAYDDEKEHSPAERMKIYETQNENGHYVVAIGYDEQNIYFMDPSLVGRRGFLPKDEFDKRWHDDEGTVDKRNVLHRLGLIIWKENGESEYARRARKID
jgi:predicted double-glycine peptidase